MVSWRWRHGGGGTAVASRRRCHGGGVTRDSGSRVGDATYVTSRRPSATPQECVNTLVKESEDRAGDLILILAGYQKEMTTFLQTNSGLTSRFPNVFSFADYSPQEMAGIARQVPPLPCQRRPALTLTLTLALTLTLTLTLTPTLTLTLALTLTLTR